MDLGITLTVPQLVYISKKERSNTPAQAVTYYFAHPGEFSAAPVPSSTNAGLAHSNAFSPNVGYGGYGGSGSVKADIGASPSVNKVTSDAKLFEHFSARLPIPEKECAICYEKLPVDEMCTINCAASHRFCYDCIGNHVKLSLSGGNDSPPYIPGCPLANGNI